MEDSRATKAAAGLAIRPGVLARVALVLFLAANVAVVTSLFAIAGPSDNPLISIGRLLGLYGAMVMAFQLILVARLPWLDRRIGMDQLTTWHRWTGFGLLFTLVGHLVFIVFGYAQVERNGAADQLVQLANTSEGVLRALVAFAVILVVGATSAKYARRRMAYETWHFVHIYTYAAVVLTFSHQIALGQSFTGSPFAREYWWTLWTVALGSVALGRIVLPLWRNLRHQLRVVAVVAESRNVVSVYMAGKRLDELPVLAGQFFLWRFMTKDRWWQANPFSLSAAPDGKYLRLTAKALGAGSSGLRDLRPGTRVFAEGPYGAFTTIHQTKENALLIAGGVGVTPIRALLQEIRGHVVLLYRVAAKADAVLADELFALARAKGAIVHILTGPSHTQSPHGPLMGAANLRALVPDLHDRDVFVCGPPGMTNAVLAGLRELDVPRAQVHAERFSLAG